MKTHFHPHPRPGLKTLLCSLGLLALLLSSAPVISQQLAFPTAQGFGSHASGGRGGQVYFVTNLNDSGAGSFREAFNAFPGEPLTIIFRVGGIINLASELRIRRSDITIAGQTAPGGGICLKGHSFVMNGARAASQGGNHGNVIIRYIRSRPGGTLSTGIYGFDMENCHDVIIDHCSFSWANEECAAMYDFKNATVQWCIVSEGLYNAGHAKGVRGYGGVWGGQNASYHHNLISNQQSRAIRFGGARAHDTVALVDYRNNVIYNSGSSGAAYGGEVEIPGGVSRINMVNNYYKPGPANSNLHFINVSYNALGVGKFYIAGNYMNGSTSETNDNWTGVSLSSVPAAEQPNAKSTTAFSLSGADITTQSAASAYTDVLLKAGANVPIRDAVDTRLVNETTNGTSTAIGATTGKGGIIDSPTEVGGWPTYAAGTAPADTDNDGMPNTWESANGTNPNVADNNGDLDGDGYTNLEEYLNFLTGENPGGSGAGLTIQENTNGFCSVDGAVESATNNFTGTGYANVNSGIGVGVTWRINVPTAGNYTLTWRYANAGGLNRPGRLLVNGTQVIANIDFPYTTDWHTWTTVSVTRSFTAGQQTIRLESLASNGLGNIDYLQISGSPTGVSCAGVTSLATATAKEEAAVAYPNPSTHTFNIRTTGKFNYVITDIHGIEVERGSGENNKTVGAALQPGTYLLRIAKQGKAETIKLIRQ
ncbi:CBM35 domain-containing protein [Chitinophaga sp. sic0106]|uniref:CBM35 domain-containing protein n=1 Tax=Chitinophaga sp. sic0106 TaxID=2854785 RepID=UPI001C464C9B|nr:CBM35 domain-containing protein [Chitinophaga sp. sic0106]MBV7533263.1 carbohydrate-binding protein [Chitinophaga sp. sic0106]